MTILDSLRRLRSWQKQKRSDSGWPLVALLCFLVAGPATAQESADRKPLRGDESLDAPGWVVSAEDAAKRIAAGDVTILDTRPARAFSRGHVPGAVRVSWGQFSVQTPPHKGKLLPDDELQIALRGVGVRESRPVLVIGDPKQGWGEDGRVAWTLISSGHPRVAIVDGGHRSLKLADVSMTKAVTAPPEGDFVVRKSSRLEAQREQVKAALAGPTVLLDTREPREFAGATPYGERRGGHVPGAKHLYYRELLDADGMLRSQTEIRAALARVGVTRQTPVIAYCTGGVRSAWLVIVLRAAGFEDVRNYAGSMWDWSAGPVAEFPLER